MAIPVPRAVVVVRSTQYGELIERHATHGQATFFLNTRGEQIEPIEAAHRRFEEALGFVLNAIPPEWRRVKVNRNDLDRFLFEPEDIVVAIGQDGLVANVAKYLGTQPVIGLNPLPGFYDGILVPHPVEAAPELLRATAQGRLRIEGRTMVEAELDDGQRLCALNEVFVGHHSHQSARYRLIAGGESEHHSSSGVIISTGTGATGWARSINLSRRSVMELPLPTERRLVFFVREAFPSVATGVELTEGLVTDQDTLEIVSEMDQGGVIFGDGIEHDHMEFKRGQHVRIHVADTGLSLVGG